MSASRLKRLVWQEIRWFATEAAIYSALVGIYCYTVIRWAGTPLNQLFHSHRTWYAVTALLLIAAQGYMLERLTSWLLRMLGRKEEGRAS